MPTPIPDTGLPSTGSDPSAPHAAAPDPPHAQKTGAGGCSTGTPDWLRTRFSDGFAAHEFG